MSEERWYQQIALGFGFTPFWWRWPEKSRMGMQFVLYLGPFWLSASWIERADCSGAN